RLVGYAPWRPAFGTGLSARRGIGGHGTISVGDSRAQSSVYSRLHLGSPAFQAATHSALASRLPRSRWALSICSGLPRRGLRIAAISSSGTPAARASATKSASALGLLFMPPLVSTGPVVGTTPAIARSTGSASAIILVSI